MIEIPAEFARSTVECEGESGAAWLAELPGIVDSLLERWACVPLASGEVMYGGVGIVVPVLRGGGAAALKVSFPHPGNVHEPDAFALWGGRGAVLLYERDDERFAMLLERVESSSLAEVSSGDEVARVAGEIHRQLTVPAQAGLPRLQEQADDWLSLLLPRDAGLPPYVVDAAVATVRELGFSQPATVIHGDFHARNILRADREPWLAVDPKGYAGDPAYDAGALLKVRALTLMDSDDLVGAVHRFLDIFAETAGLDRARTQRWAQLHIVQATLWARDHGVRIARSGPELTRLTAFADHLAEVLT